MEGQSPFQTKPGGGDIPPIPPVDVLVAVSDGNDDLLSHFKNVRAIYKQMGSDSAISYIRFNVLNSDARELLFIWVIYKDMIESSTGENKAPYDE